MLFNLRFLKGLCFNDTNIWKLSIINRIVWAKCLQFLGLTYEKSKNKKFLNRLISSLHIYYLKPWKNSYWLRNFSKLFVLIVFDSEK